MEPACLVVSSEAVEAPLRCSLVEPLPGPFHDDGGATARKRACDPVDHIGWIGDVMEGGGGDDCVNLRRKLGALELDPLVVRVLGCLRVDADGVVAFGAQHRYETAEWAAADVDHPRRGHRQTGADRRPKAG